MQTKNVARFQSKLYKTRDLAESAALIAHRQPLLTVKCLEGVCWFYFNFSEECKRLSQLFYFGDLPVNAREYSQLSKGLTKKMFEAIDEINDHR